MICTIEDIGQIYDDTSITILNNPNTTTFSGSITLYFTKFSELSIYTLTLGNILKNGSVSFSYKFYFINNTLSKQISDNINLELNITVNDEKKVCICDILKNQNIFNLSCSINDYSPSCNIDINIKDEYINYIVEFNPITIYIDIPRGISTSTLTAGYITRGGCTKSNYAFTIINNYLNGYIIENMNGKFKLKLENFNNDATCKLKYENEYE